MASVQDNHNYEKEAMYLSSSIHYLTENDAKEMAGINDEIRQDDDGSYSLYRLTNKPVQHGQAKWERALSKLTEKEKNLLGIKG